MNRIFRKSLVMLVGLLSLGVPNTVLPFVTISINGTGAFNVTPGLAVINQSIATITLDADQAYQVTLRDNNNGNLINGSNSLAYTVKYDNGSEITLSTVPLSVETGSSVSSGVRSLTLFVAGGASVGIPAGAYTATITAEILAN